MKNKISITVEESILTDIDALAKSRNINRSKVIEEILEKEIHKTPVLILTAGQEKISGTELSLHRFKKGTLLSAQIEYLRSNGILDIHVNTDSGNIMHYLSTHYPDVKIIYTENMIGNGGALKACAKRIDRPFIFMYGNVMPNTNLNSLESFMRKDNLGLVLVLKSMSNPSKFGSAIMEGTKILRFNEKDKKAVSYLIFTGLGMVAPSSLNELKNEGKLELQLEKIKDKHGFIDESEWKSFKTAKDFLD